MSFFVEVSTIAAYDLFMIKTTTKHTLTVNATDLKKNLCASYLQLLQDELDAKEIDFEYFKMDLDRFQDELDSVVKSGFAQSFREGNSMILLNGEDFDFVENWFEKNKNLSEELVVRILDDEGNQMEVVQHVDLSY